MSEKKTVLDWLPKYEPDADKKHILESTSNVRVRQDKEKRIVEFEADFCDIVNKDVLYAIEEEIAAAYALRYTRILPHYSPDLFGEHYIPQLIRETERRGIVARGYFDGCRYKLLEDRLSFFVQINMNGVSLMVDAKTPRTVEEIIAGEFGIQINVTVTPDENAAAAEAHYLEMQQKQLYGLFEESKQTVETASKPPVNTVSHDEPILEKDGNIIKSGYMRFDISNPEQLWGSNFDIEPVAISSVNGQASGVVVLCSVVLCEEKLIKLDARHYQELVYVHVSDKQGSLTVKIDRSDKKAAEMLAYLTENSILAIRGDIYLAQPENQYMLKPGGIKSVSRVRRTDKAGEKRVELHLHTKMSALDGLIDPAEAVKTAIAMGHKAIAVTDHGNVQAFPEMMMASEVKKKKTDPPGFDPPPLIKVIYGMEGYYVDDTSRAFFGSNKSDFNGNFTVFDIETTGLSALNNKITEIGAVHISNGVVTDSFDTFVDPGEHIPDEITKLTGITDEMVAGAPSQEQAVRAFLDFAGDSILIAHNADFDTAFVRKVCDDNGIVFSNSYLDTLSMSRYVNPELNRHKLKDLSDYFKIDQTNFHRASDDAATLALVFIEMVKKLHNEGIDSIEDMERIMSDKVDPLKLRTNHIIILTKNKDGLKNLYKMISESYLKYYRRHPRIPKTVLNGYREGLLIGSACSEGELYEAILDGKSHSELLEIADYYDYLEIQPICNNLYLIEQNKVPSEEGLRDINRKIVAIAKELGKPFVATSDAHFIDKEDDVFRKIFLTSMKYSDANRDSGLYLKTTDEMLDEFSYLGEETAYEAVIRNPNLVADMVDQLRPIPKGTFSPNVEGADKLLSDMCYNRAHKLYGDELPAIIANRLDEELSAIIKHGFSALYIIARKLVAYSESEGYLVGSRGSVGSSIVAFMSEISEVNPLPPHYVCPGCRYNDFNIEKCFGSGFDLPDKDCPVCGAKMRGDGHDIPFQTFLGFYGEKSPDIDLNFSGMVQGKVHKYTETIFGSENVFRAGTLTTVADKTAFGYAKKYAEEVGIDLNSAELNRLAVGCTGVKKTTGQHPGGIIVIPKEYEVYDFTPIQHPADDPNSDITTTHFAFSYLHDTVLKLDELGHDVPTKYKMIERYTGTSVMDVPMNDPAVYELFRSTESIGVTPEDIFCDLGTYALPELGTNLVIKVLKEAKPKNFADMLQVSGLTHGTDVWQGNARDLIKKNICDISEVIGTRDGIMLNLIRYGLDNSIAFTITEFVRKNKKGLPLTEEMITTMKSHDVPDWYIESLAKIKYMFPKAHAAAYVMSAIRLGWYKVHMPLEFYAAYFTAAPDNVDAEIVLSGRRAVCTKLNEIKEKQKARLASQKEIDMIDPLQIINESMVRGIKYLPIDLYHSDAKAFLPENGCIRLPFASLNGVGETAAAKICAARDATEIFSIEQLRQDASLTKTVIETLMKNNVLDGLNQTNQLSFF